MRKLDKMVRKFNNREQIYIFNSKVDFNRTFSQYIGRRWIYVPESDDKQIESFIKMHKEIIVKPNSLSSGRGIYKIHINAINNLKEFINNLRGDNCLIEEIIIPHEKMKELNSVAVNTIRAYTFIDESGKPHIIATTLRVAGDANSCTDNLHSGGIVASIDPESGVCFTMATNMNFKKFVCHPVTKTIIPGFQVPFWDDVKELLLNAALIVPTVRYVGWDVAITPDGPILIEGNHDANHDAMQIADQIGKYRKIMDLLQE